jgi:hypothetical protein
MPYPAEKVVKLIQKCHTERISHPPPSPKKKKTMKGKERERGKEGREKENKRTK